MIPYGVLIGLVFHYSLNTFGLSTNWIQENQEGYSIYYTPSDAADLTTYRMAFQRGISRSQEFFGKPYIQHFDIYIHPNRASLDSTWQSDWGAPAFKSECWMVASGVAGRLDLIAPNRWDADACEHPTMDTTAMQNLIAHELVHVFHGQHNPSPDFSEVSGLDWFVEGLATYASGQCDSLRMATVLEALNEDKIPGHLSAFWTGSLRYGLSGSLAMYLDAHYGRENIYQLLACTNLNALLDKLGVDEATLLHDWKAYVKSL